MKEKVAIIGSGLMGHGIAQIFALAGHETVMYDTVREALDKALDSVRKNLGAGAAAGCITAEEAEAALPRLRVEGDMAAAVGDADFVFECAPERMELKQGIFKTLDGLCRPEAVLASNTSVMSITEIASGAAGRSRIIGTHFWNPPYLIPLVEVVETVDTSPETVRRTMDILAGAGKKPIHVRKDVPGFVANRMQHALWREALHILDEGIADAATIDSAVRNSFGMRLPQLGPLENADMVGLDLTWNIHSYLLKHLASNTEPSPTVRRKVERGELGFKTAGHGLRDWTEAEMEASRRNLSDYLMDFAVRARNKEE